MPLKKDFSDLRLSFEPLTLYQKFEQVCVLMHSVVQVRSVILIALLAVVRKLIILDLSSTDAFHLLALAAAILALGAVYWLVRDQGQPREIIAAGDG